MEKVQRYGYSIKRILNRTASIELDKFDLNTGKFNISAYNEETDLQAIKLMYLENKILTEEQLEGQLKFLEDNPDRVICWNVYKDGDEIIGNSIITKFGEAEDEIRKSILNKNIKDCKNAGIKKLLIFLAGNNLELKEKYEDLGIAFNPDLVLYHRDI